MQMSLLARIESTAITNILESGSWNKDCEIKVRLDITIIDSQI